MGNKTRYDGDHSHDPLISQVLGLFFDFVPVCPEVECGMPVPREPIQLVGDPDNPKLLTREAGVDKTQMMDDWLPGKLDFLEKENLSGFIFKSKSPSSGLFQVKVFKNDGSFKRIGTGLFARAFTRRFPLIPVEEAERLHDPKIREKFIQDIFSYIGQRDLVSG